MSIAKKLEYIEQYQKDNIRRVVVKLNKRTEQDLIDKIDSVDNMQGYIKELIRNDIQNNG